MFSLGALWLGQRVKRRAQGRRRVLRENGREEEEQEEESGVLQRCCHGDDLSSNCQGGPLGYSCRRKKRQKKKFSNSVQHFSI